MHLVCADTLLLKWRRVQYLVLLSRLKFIVGLYFYTSTPFSSVLCAWPQWLCILLWALPKLGRPALSILCLNKSCVDWNCCSAGLLLSHHATTCVHAATKDPSTRIERYQRQNSTSAPALLSKHLMRFSDLHATLNLFSKAILYLSAKQSNLSVTSKRLGVLQDTGDNLLIQAEEALGALSLHVGWQQCQAPTHSL